MSTLTNKEIIASYDAGHITVRMKSGNKRLAHATPNGKSGKQTITCSELYKDIKLKRRYYGKK